MNIKVIKDMKYSKELKEKILKLVELYPMNYGQCCASSSYHELGNEIKESVPLLSSDEYSFKTRIYWILNDIFDFPKCEICGNKITRNVKTLELGYRKYENSSITCSEKCQKIARLEKAKKTCLERYGVENPYQSPEIIEKIKKKNLERYGVENGGNTKEGRAKAEATLKKHFGEAGLKSEIVRQHKRDACQRKYGKDNYTQTDAYKNARHKEKIKRFIDNALNDPEIEFLNLQSISADITIDDLHHAKFDFKCKKCGNVYHNKLSYSNYYAYGTFSSCNKCHPYSCTSHAEKEIYEYIKSFYDGEILTNKRSIVSGYELDLYIPEKKLAIEYDGIYWHSEECGTPKSYHLNKTDKCEKSGIHLIHIFESEWKTKNDIVKSRIRNLFGLYDRCIFARKCTVKEIDDRCSKEFQTINHIQGYVKSKINLGLFYNNELVAVMTFGKPRFNKKYEWELLRFCTKLGYHIPGAAGKMLKHFERTHNPTSLISYADRRWSQGKLYKALGFTLDHVSSPNYWYIYGINVESRMKYQKHKLKKILENYDPSLSEHENMKNNGYKRIFDCGNLVFVKQYL